MKHPRAKVYPRCEVPSHATVNVDCTTRSFFHLLFKDVRNNRTRHSLGQWKTKLSLNPPTTRLHLAMIGRALFRLPLRSRLLRANNVTAQHDCTTHLPLVAVVRSYATPGRPKSVVGEPSRPVKRAVKKAAAKQATGDSPAEKQVRAKQRNATTKKSKAKKALTPEEKAAKKEKAVAKKARAKVTAEKTKLADLRQAALKPPKLSRAANAYLTFVTEKMKDKVAYEANKDKMKDIARQWKNITPSEHEVRRYDIRKQVVF